MQTVLEDPLSSTLPGSVVNHDNLQSAHVIQQYVQQQQAAANRSPSRAGSPSAVR